MKRVIVLGVILLLTNLAYANQQGLVARGKSLTAQEIELLKEAKQLVGEVDTKPLPQIIAEIEKSKYPQVNVQLRQAMARAYADIVKEHNIEGQTKKEWLYSMVSLNMAYLQFGGSKDNSAAAKPLNKLILRKLKEYLPRDIYQSPGFLCSLG